MHSRYNATIRRTCALSMQYLLLCFALKQRRRENPETPGQKRKARPPESEASRKFSGSKN